MALAKKKTRGRELLEQRLSSYQRNPDFFDTTCDAVLAIRGVEDQLQELDNLTGAVNTDFQQEGPVGLGCDMLARMKIIRREAFEHRGKRYEIVVENAGAQLRARALRNGKQIKNLEVLSQLNASTSYDTSDGMKSVDQLIGLAQTRIRDRVR